MTEALTRKLDSFVRLSPDDRQALRSAFDLPARLVPARRDFAREGDAPRTMHLVREGWAARHKTLPDGRRQIVALLIPGDLVDIDLQLVRERDHSIGAICECSVSDVPFAGSRPAGRRQSRASRQAMRMDALVVAATSHEWTLNVGQRSAYERISHLFAEMTYRLRRAGLAVGDETDWPLTQHDLADTTGLTPVHVNRTLQLMRKDGLISLVNRRLIIPDLDRLERAGMFNSGYLHLDSGEAALAR